MRFRLFTAVAAASIGPVLLGQTVPDIVSGVVFARGGAQKVASVETERFSGILYTPLESGTFVLELKRPNKVRMQIAIGGQVVVKGFDGTTAWKLDGSDPAAKPVKMDTAEGETFSHSQDIDGLLVGFAEKGTTIEIVDKEMLGSSLVWKLKVTPKSGDTQYCYVETSGSQLLMKEVSVPRPNDKPATVKQFFRDFRKVKDLTFPFVITSMSDDNFDSTTTLAVNELLINEPIADERFDMKTAAVDSAAPAKK